MLLIILCSLWLGLHCVITQINADKCQQDLRNVLLENTVHRSPRPDTEAIAEEMNGPVSNWKYLRKAD